MMKPFENIARIMAGTFGALWAYLDYSLPMLGVCTMAVLIDCFTAWRLNVRVKQHYGVKVASGKFKSRYAMRIFSKLLKIYALVIFAYMIQKEIFYYMELHIPNLIAGAYCFLQIISILENESSENDARWAKVLQRILVDKAERHFDVALPELKPKEEKIKTNGKD